MEALKVRPAFGRHPGQGSEATADPGTIGPNIIERGPVLVVVHVSTVQ